MKIPKQIWPLLYMWGCIGAGCKKITWQTVTIVSWSTHNHIENKKRYTQPYICLISKKKKSKEIHIIHMTCNVFLLQLLETFTSKHFLSTEPKLQKTQSYNIFHLVTVFLKNERTLNENWYLPEEPPLGNGLENQLEADTSH